MCVLCCVAMESSSMWSSQAQVNQRALLQVSAFVLALIALLAPKANSSCDSTSGELLKWPPTREEASARGELLLPGGQLLFMLPSQVKEVTRRVAKHVINQPTVKGKSTVDHVFVVVVVYLFSIKLEKSKRSKH